MADTSPRSVKLENGGKSSLWLPLLFFALFLSASFYCAWLIWSQYAQAQSSRVKAEARLELLQSRKKALEDLLELPPCDAASRTRLLLTPHKASPYEKKVSAVEDKIGGPAVSRGAKKCSKVGALGFPKLIGKNDPTYASPLKGENINAAPELSWRTSSGQAGLPFPGGALKA